LKEIVDYWDGKTNAEFLTPKLTDMYRNILAAWYDSYSEELAGIEQRYPAIWTKIRGDVKSVKEADMLYDQLEDGQRRIYLKFKMKSLEKSISALRDRLRRQEVESFQRF